MSITVDALNEKYKQEDENWDFKLFFSWLAKKGISGPVVNAALKRVLLETDVLPDLHDTFDNNVLSLARDMQRDIEEKATQFIQASLDEELQWSKLTKFQKIKDVLRGRA